MKEKIKKIFFKVAEIGTVVWAINGMNAVKGYETSCGGLLRGIGSTLATTNDNCIENPHLGPILFYFFAASLILYLLNKYERKN